MHFGDSFNVRSLIDAHESKTTAPSTAKKARSQRKEIGRNIRPFILTSECWSCFSIFKTRCELFKHLDGCSTHYQRPLVERGLIHKAHERAIACSPANIWNQAGAGLARKLSIPWTTCGGTSSCTSTGGEARPPPRDKRSSILDGPRLFCSENRLANDFITRNHNLAASFFLYL